MNRRKLIKILGLGCASLPFLSFFVKGHDNYPKMGYFSVKNALQIDSVGCWVVIDNKTGESPIPKDYGYNIDGRLSIWSMNDKEGWVNAIVLDEEWNRITHKYKKFYGDFRLKYTGSNPKYQHFV